MGRSVSYPAGAQVAFIPLEADDNTWDWEYDALVEDIRTQVRTAFPSFDPVECWRDREDRVLMRNTFADIGISTYGGIAAIWMIERCDQTYAYAREWGQTSALARGWLSRAAPRFNALFARLELVGRCSNGEAIYQLPAAA